MKLPIDYRIESLTDLSIFVSDSFTEGETLEMSKEQYITYKRLVWESDPIKRFEGMEIVIPKP